VPERPGWVESCAARNPRKVACRAIPVGPVGDCTAIARCTRLTAATTPQGLRENPNQRTCSLVAELAIKLGVRAPRTNKKVEVIAMMKRAKGAASRIVEATGWQTHTERVRAHPRE